MFTNIIKKIVYISVFILFFTMNFSLDHVLVSDAYAAGGGGEAKESPRQIYVDMPQIPVPIFEKGKRKALMLYHVSLEVVADEEHHATAQDNVGKIKQYMPLIQDRAITTLHRIASSPTASQSLRDLTLVKKSLMKAADQVCNEVLGYNPIHAVLIKNALEQG